MRYFRYKNSDKSRNNALKAQYAALTVSEQRAFRRERFWRKFCTVVSFVIYFSCTMAGICLLRFIPQPSGWFWGLLAIIGKGLAGLLLLVAAGAVTAGLTAPLWKKVESLRPPSMKKEIFAEACGHLRDYYELREPYIITKCFDATDKKFRNHDVCIFVARNELRITTDLMRGFLHGERDLGCYAFTRDEITLSKRWDENHLIAELKADGTVFLLGYRAKGFIEKYITANHTD